MLSAMRHRGPDDSGIFADDVVTLGMVRLSIIDTSVLAHQPMSNEDGTVVIVYNGEMYNFGEEREILAKKGVVFHSRSDTEVILRMYEAYGDDLVLRIRGMFAFAIYDRRGGRGRERLLLARDHLGIKPLLYTKDKGLFVFASELRALLASGLIEKRFSPQALRHLLTYGSITQPLTAVEGVRMLLPGHRMIVTVAGEHTECFWRMATDRYPDIAKASYAEQVLAVRMALEEAVRLQMVSDVPLGAFLSGGVDSSLLVALMARESTHKVRTFSVGFGEEGRAIDETDDAQKIARYIGTDHSRIVIRGADVVARLPHIVCSLDQPSVDGVNSYFVSWAARQAVTVAISGTGGDELFAGYPWFAEMMAFSAHERKMGIAGSMRRLVGRALSNPTFDTYTVGVHGATLEAYRARSGFLSHFARRYQIFGGNGASRMIHHSLRHESGAGREAAHDIESHDELSSGTSLQRSAALCLRGYTKNQLLHDIDAVSMAHSLEVRVPLLDHRLLDLALSLPDVAKLEPEKARSDPFGTYADTGVKKILLAVGRDLLPEGLAHQRKRGFALPMEHWLKHDIREAMEDALSPGAVIRRGLLDEHEVATVKEKFLAGELHWSYTWLLMVIELWCREVLDI